MHPEVLAALVGGSATSALHGDGILVGAIILGVLALMMRGRGSRRQQRSGGGGLKGLLFLVVIGVVLFIMYKNGHGHISIPPSIQTEIAKLTHKSG